MALFTEKSYNDIAGDWEEMQRREMERQQQQAAQQYAAAQNKVAINQSKSSSNPLESVLSGIGNTIGNVGKSLGAMFGGAGTNNAITVGLDALINGKSFAQAARDGQKRQDDLIKSIYGTDDTKDAYAKNLGTSIDAAATLTDFIPGLGTGAKVALNVGQGIASGAANPLIEKGTQATLEDAMKGALVGGASAGVGQYVGGKLAGKTAGNNILSKALNSNVGKGAITGGLAGATGGGLYSALNGGDILSGALQGAQGGALTGGTLAGTMGLIGTGLNKLNDRVMRNAAGSTPQATIDDVTTTKPTRQAMIDEVAEQYTKKQPTRKTIDVQYDEDAGTKVNVNRNKSQYKLAKNAGSTLDGILGPNNTRKLANATVDQKSQFNRLFDNNTNDMSDVIRSGVLDLNGDDALAKQGLLREILGDDVYEALRNGTREYADIQNAGFEGTLANGKSDLPQLNRQQYYEDTIGKLGKNGNAGLRAADVPDYMQSHLSDNAGKNALGGAASDNASILRELFGQEGDLGEMYKRYEDLAQAQNRNVIYTNDNALGALAMDPDLNAKVTEKFLSDSYPTRKVDVEKILPLSDQVDVDTPYGRKVVNNDVTPGRRQAQTVAPEAQNVQNVRRQPAQPTTNTQLIQEGTPEYDALIRQEKLANRQRQLRQTIVGGVMDQYGTTRLNDRINGLDNAIMDLAEIGLTDRAEIDGFVSRITGADGEVPKLIRKSLNEAGDVQARINKTMDQVYEESGAGADAGAQKRIKNFFDSRSKKYQVDQNGNMNRLDMYDLGKELEREGYKMVDRGERTQNSTTTAYGDALVILSREVIDTATDGVDIRANIDVNKLKNTLPGNKDWAARVDDFAKNATTIQDARSFIEAPTKLGLLAQAEDYNRNTFGQNAGDAGKTAAKIIRAGTSANPIAAGAQIGVAAASEAPVVKQAVIKKSLKNYKNIQAGGDGYTGMGKATQTVKNIASKAGNKIGGVWDALNNDTVSSARLGGNVGENYNLPSFGEVATRQLSRQAGINAANEQDRQNAIQQGMQEMQDIENNYVNSMNQLQQSYQAPQQQMMNQGTGALDKISTAMESALAAGDLTAYSKLADLYKQAYNIYSLQNPTATTSDAKALNATQAKAVTGLNQLQQLATMQPGIRTALSNSPLSGLVDLTGGDSYNSQADSLASTIGYLLSGANIKDNEIAAVKRDYVPSTYDSPQVRQEKLSRAEQLLRSYLSDTSALTSL